MSNQIGAYNNHNLINDIIGKTKFSPIFQDLAVPSALRFNSNCTEQTGGGGGGAGGSTKSLYSKIINNDSEIFGEEAFSKLLSLVNVEPTKIKIKLTTKLKTKLKTKRNRAEAKLNNHIAHKTTHKRKK